MSDSLWPHELQWPKFPCPSLSPRICLNSCSLGRWRHSTISWTLASSNSLREFLLKYPYQFMTPGTSPISKSQQLLYICLFLQISGQWFALWPRSSDLCRKSHGFSKNFFLLCFEVMNSNGFYTFYVNIRAEAGSYTEILLLKTLCQPINYNVLISNNHNGYHLRTYFAWGICVKNLHILLDTRTYIEHGIFLHLLVSSLISFTSVL